MIECSVLVLAGGRSRRFGRDKLDADWRGRTLRDHVVLADTDDSPGPLMAVASALATARHDVALVVAADMPALVTFQRARASRAGIEGW